MKTKVKKRVKGAPRKLARTARKSVKTSNAAIIGSRYSVSLETIG